jgi:hypothetical protein
VEQAISSGWDPAIRSEKLAGVSLHAFTLILDQDAEPFLEQLQASGCRDAIFRVEDGVPLAHFFREAPTLQRAMATATREICATGLDVVGVARVANPTNRGRGSLG